MICRNCGKLTPDDKPKCVHCGADTAAMKPKKPSDGAPPETQISDAAQTQVTPGSGASGGPEDAGKTQMGAPSPSPPKQPGPDASEPKPPEAKKSVPPPKPPEGISREEATLRETLAGKYEIIRKLGSGGMATVYLAKEIALDRMVAIKLLPKQFMRDAGFVKRFKSEAQIAANLEHPHIVRIYQISEENDQVFFVMSFVPGGSITDKIKEKGTIPIDDIIKWGMQTCDALAHGHANGVIHRDLKPDNVMLDRKEDVVVMDYGIARAGQGTGLTQTGSVIGTPQYMSPEQARGTELDARSDIYSMGILLYQMATGELPFQATDAASLMYMHVHEAPEPPDAKNAKVPVWLRNIILKCLAKNPADRFASADELKAALAEKYSPKLTTTPLAERDRKQKRMMFTAAAVIVVIAIAAIGFLMRQRSLEKQQAEQARIEAEQQAEQARQQEIESAAEKDNQAFTQAETADTRESYNTYLMLYPDGRHVDEARAAIAAIAEREKTEAARQQQAQVESEEARQKRLAAEEERRRREAEEERARQDDAAYQQAMIASTKQSFSTYLELYPEGRHRDEAMAKLTALDAAEAERMRREAEAASARDNQAYELASKTNTKQSYNTYLMTYPNGRHASEAQAKIAAFDRKEAEAAKVRTALSAISLRMAPVPAGTFKMGSASGGGDEKPVKDVTVSAFEISVTEISQSQYKAIMADNPSFFKLDDNNPVEKVTWKDAITFCNKLSEEVGLEPCYNLSTGACDFSKSGFRLPTESEWEYACRAGSGLEYTLGDGESALDRAGWYQRNSRETTHPVGQKTANAFGLYDVHGNVWEWCNDWYAKNAYESMAADNPTGPARGDDKVVRGGSWLDGPNDCRSAKRRNFDPEKSYSDIGFRIVRR